MYANITIINTNQKSYLYNEPGSCNMIIITLISVYILII